MKYSVVSVLVNSMWIDTHAHLAEEEYLADIDQVIQNAIQHNIQRVLLIGCGVIKAKEVIALAKRYPKFFRCVIGFHPEDILEITETDWLEMANLIQDPLVLAVGEIGLDYYWDKDPAHHEIQKEVFIRQIKLANQFNKPISVHSRDSIQVTYDLLKQYPVNRFGIMHCYSGSVEMAERFIQLGFYISLAGPLTFKNAHIPKDVVTHVDIHHLLIETDSPYLSPEPFRGKRNESAYVEYTGIKMADLKQIEPIILENILLKNYLNLFPEETIELSDLPY